MPTIDVFDGAKTIVYEVTPDGHWQYVGWVQKNGEIRKGHHRKSDGRPTINYYCQWYVYRLTYDAVKGHEVPNGLVPDHTCKKAWCINPDHLEAVTQAVNLKRTGLPDGDANVGQALKTHCPQGHEYSEQNTYTTHRVRVKNGREVNSIERQCKLCMREHKRNRRALYRSMGLTYS